MSSFDDLVGNVINFIFDKNNDVSEKATGALVSMGKKVPDVVCENLIKIMNSVECNDTKIPIILSIISQISDEIDSIAAVNVVLQILAEFIQLDNVKSVSDYCVAILSSFSNKNSSIIADKFFVKKVTPPLIDFLIYRVRCKDLSTFVGNDDKPSTLFSSFCNSIKHITSTNTRLRVINLFFELSNFISHTTTISFDATNSLSDMVSSSLAVMVKWVKLNEIKLAELFFKKLGRMLSILSESILLKSIPRLLNALQGYVGVDAIGNFSVIAISSMFSILETKEIKLKYDYVTIREKLISFIKSNYLDTKMKKYLNKSVDALASLFRLGYFDFDENFKNELKEQYALFILNNLFERVNLSDKVDDILSSELSLSFDNDIHCQFLYNILRLVNKSNKILEEQVIKFLDMVCKDPSCHEVKFSNFAKSLKENALCEQLLFPLLFNYFECCFSYKLFSVIIDIQSSLNISLPTYLVPDLLPRYLILYYSNPPALDSKARYKLFQILCNLLGANSDDEFFEAISKLSSDDRSKIAEKLCTIRISPNEKNDNNQSTVLDDSTVSMRNGYTIVCGNLLLDDVIATRFQDINKRVTENLDKESQCEPLSKYFGLISRNPVFSTVSRIKSQFVTFINSEKIKWKFWETKQSSSQNILISVYQVILNSPPSSELDMLINEVLSYYSDMSDKKYDDTYILIIGSIFRHKIYNKNLSVEREDEITNSILDLISNPQSMGQKLPIILAGSYLYSFNTFLGLKTCSFQVLFNLLDEIELDADIVQGFCCISDMILMFITERSSLDVISFYIERLSKYLLRDFHFEIIKPMYKVLSHMKDVELDPTHLENLVIFFLYYLVYSNFYGMKCLELLLKHTSYHDSDINLKSVAEHIFLNEESIHVVYDTLLKMRMNDDFVSASSNFLIESFKCAVVRDNIDKCICNVVNCFALGYDYSNVLLNLDECYHMSIYKAIYKQPFSTRNLDLFKSLLNSTDSHDTVVASIINAFEILDDSSLSALHMLSRSIDSIRIINNQEKFYYGLLVVKYMANNKEIDSLVHRVVEFVNPMDYSIQGIFTALFTSLRLDLKVILEYACKHSANKFFLEAGVLFFASIMNDLERNDKCWNYIQFILENPCKTSLEALKLLSNTPICTETSNLQSVASKLISTDDTLSSSLMLFILPYLAPEDLISLLPSLLDYMYNILLFESTSLSVTDCLNMVSLVSQDNSITQNIDKLMRLYPLLLLHVYSADMGLLTIAISSVSKILKLSEPNFDYNSFELFLQNNIPSVISNYQSKTAFAESVKDASKSESSRLRANAILLCTYIIEVDKSIINIIKESLDDNSKLVIATALKAISIIYEKEKM